LNQGHRLKHDWENPAFQQTLYLQGMAGSFGYGQVDSTIKQINPASSMTAALGVPTFIYMGINLQNFGAYTRDDYQYGTPYIVAYQTIKGIGLIDGEMSAPTVSPFYIKPYKKDSEQIGETIPVTHYLELQNRKLPLPTASVTEFGQTSVSHRLRMIIPYGQKSYKPGFPKLNGPKHLRPVGKTQASFGMALVYRPADNPQITQPSGAESTAFGRPQVEGWIRTLNVSGLDSVNWGSDRLHPPEPLIPTGFDAAHFGLTWVSYRVRNLQTIAFEDTAMGYEGGLFAARMAIKRGQPIFPQGFSETEYGMSARVSHQTQRLGPSSVTGIVGGPKFRNQREFIQAWPLLYWPSPVGRAAVVRG
jgi:hypothetical protein